MNNNYLTILRPAQWLKNTMLFFPPFLSGHIFKQGIVSKGLLPFIAFCMVSSAGYIFNDLLDRERDIHHSQKRLRPISSGTVGLVTAMSYAILLLLAGLVIAFFQSVNFLLLLLGYTVVTVLYTLFLKSMPVIDIFCISAGFLIRLQTGGELFGVPISPWLFLTVFLLSIFLSTGKRLSESQLMGNSAADHRASLAGYPEGFLSGTMYMTGSAVLVTYAMYALNKPKLIYTVPLCLFGLLRYMLRIGAGKDGDPTESLLKDWILFAVSLVWLLMVVWSIYL